MNYFILVLSCLLSFISVAQTNSSNAFSASAGEPYSEVGGKDYEYFSDGSGNCILVKTYYQTVVIQHYDVSAMKEISRNEYTDFPKGLQMEKCLKTGNRLFYLYSISNKSKTRSLYAREINTTTGTFMNAQLLFETKGSVEFIYANADGIPDLYDISTNFEVKKSFDQSKILIHYKREATTKNTETNYEVIGLYVFDANLTLLWGDEKTMPYTEKKQNILSYSISKSGKACMLAYTNDGSNLQYEFFSASQGTAVQKIKLDIDPQILLQDIKMTENSEGNITCTGYYNNSIERDLVFQKPDLLDMLFIHPVTYQGPTIVNIQNVSGIIRLKISTDGELLGKYTHAFPMEFINKYESKIEIKRNAKKEEKQVVGIPDLLLYDVIENTDGSTLIIGEQKFIRIEQIVKQVTNPNEPTLNNRTTTENRRLYYTKNIVVTKLDPSGNVLWEIKLPKYQLSYMGMGSIGFKYIEASGMNYFIFLDNYERSSVSENSDPPLFKVSDGGRLFAYKVDASSGTFTNNFILDTKTIADNPIDKFPTVRIFNADAKTLMLEFNTKGKFNNMLKIKIN